MTLSTFKLIFFKKKTIHAYSFVIMGKKHK